MRAGEKGASGLFILVLLVLAALAVLAVTALNRTTTTGAEHDQTTASLAKAAAALDAFAGASGRLPCPADPGVDAGIEVTSGATGCQFPKGTVPWNTIGLRRDDAYDAWGHKISYRVYSGATGFTQAGGMSRVDCDSVVGAGGVTGSGLCRTDHTTPASAFVPGKGLKISDYTATYDTTSPTGGAAYVLISHGPTGLGSYTSSGVQLDLPKGDEKDNTNDTGPFHIEAFSDPNTSATASSHFDDIIAYRLVTDVVKNANLEARPWAGVLSAVAFDKGTLTAALGSAPSSDTGQSTIAFTNATVSAFDSGGAQDVSYVKGGGSDPDAIGGVSGGDGLLDSGAGEGFRIDFSQDARQFAFTVDHFDDTASLHENVEVRFFEVNGATTTLKATQVEPSCAANGKVTSFSIDACSAFNRVEIRPIAMTDGLTPSSFSLNEIRTCIDGVTCQTDLQSTGNVCSTKVFTPCSIGTDDVSQLKITLANPNGFDLTGTSFTDTYPAGLVNASTPGAASTCGGVIVASGGGAGISFTGGTVPKNASCNVTLNVTSAAASVYNNVTSNVTTATTVTQAGISGTMTALQHPGVGLVFVPPSVLANASSVLTITLTNGNSTAITGAAFVDSYPAGLANASPASSSCGGTVSTSTSPPQVSLSGGTIPAAGSCTVTVSVSSPSTGTFTDTLAAGAVTSGNAGANLAGASAALVVN